MAKKASLIIWALAGILIFVTVTTSSGAEKRNLSGHKQDKRRGFCNTYGQAHQTARGRPFPGCRLVAWVPGN